MAKKDKKTDDKPVSTRKGSVGGSRLGIPNKSHTEARNRLDALGCDPLEFTAKVMLGEELQGDHPFLAVLLEKLERFETAFRDYNKITEARIVQTTIIKAKKMMGGTETDKTLRLNSAHKLMDFAYPKLRAMDVKVEKVAENVEEMSDDELIQILRDGNDEQNKRQESTTRH